MLKANCRTRTMPACVTICATARVLPKVIRSGAPSAPMQNRSVIAVGTMREPSHVHRRRVAALLARPAFHRRFELPDRRVSGPLDGIERQAGAGLTAVALDLKAVPGPHLVYRPWEGQGAQGGGHGTINHRQGSQNRSCARLPRLGELKAVGSDENSAPLYRFFRCFDPRPREGGDRLTPVSMTRSSWFQSTPPRRGRPLRAGGSFGCLGVSIHAPAKGRL